MYNDKNVFKAVAVFVTALIVFDDINYYYASNHNNIIKYNVQKHILGHIVCDSGYNSIYCCYHL